MMGWAWVNDLSLFAMPVIKGRNAQRPRRWQYPSRVP